MAGELFTAIIGDPGSGKSNLMTAILYDAHDNGTPVVANYLLRFPYRQMPFSEMVTLPEDLQDCIIGADELPTAADSYEFLMSGPKNMAKLVSQLRKRNATCVYTAQRENMIAKRLRQLTTAFIVMEDVDKGRMTDPVTGEEARSHRDVCLGFFRMKMYDDRKRRVGNAKIFDGRDYWTLYDTTQIIEK